MHMSSEQLKRSTDVIHVEVYVVPRRRRAEFRRKAREPIGHARALTRANGGSGPDFYLADPGRPGPTYVPFGRLFKLRADEDLWVEITRYPSKQRRRAVMKALWRDEEFVQSIEKLEALNSTRVGAWAIANGVLQRI